jgi:hypothetical protein
MKFFNWKEEAPRGATVRNTPRVLITLEAKKRLDLYIKLADGEISGLGRVRRLGPDFLIEEVFLFEQESGPGDTELDPDSVAGWLTELIRRGEDPSQIKLWWHSHATMSVFWSGTDEATASRFANSWMISVVGNKRGEYLCRLDLYEPVRLTIDGLRLEVHWSEDSALRTEVEAEIKEKVRKKVIIPSPTPRPWLGEDFPTVLSSSPRKRQGRKKRRG